MNDLSPDRDSARTQNPRTDLRVVLLDVDGTLLDSNDAHARCWIEVLAGHGHVRDYADVRQLIGMGGDKLLPLLLDLPHDSAEGKAIAAERGSLFLEKYLPGLKPTRGARALVEKVLAAGLKPVVATSAGDELHALLQHACVADLVELSATSEDARRSKPDDDIVQAALRKAGVRPAQAIMVGDTPYDVQAANAAGVRAVTLRCGGWWSDDQFGEQCEIYDDPADLLRSWEASLLGRSVA
ncbi:MAG: hydrolase, haloacid dehalogenase-like family [Variovorax sp.]|jgi:HAD superfamily hydrolase (TIGR01509 family)|nr:hydrolase, haloacid dehalogenase-like family [Variovorax sp.]